MRLFFALFPPRETAEALHKWAARLQEDCGGRVTAPEQIHLTVRFLGEVADPSAVAVPEVRRRELTIDQARYWPHNRIVWVGPKGSRSEHVTLIRKAARPAAYPPLPVVSWPVQKLLLVRSRLGPAGSRYEVLRRYPLPATGTAA